MWFDAGTYPGKIIDIPRFVGVEIEAEKGKNGEYLTTWDSDIFPPDTKLTSDFSLQGGLEFQTPPASLNKYEDVINKTTSILKEKKWQASKRCGLHVHLDARDIRNEAKSLARLFRTFYSVDDILKSTQPWYRWNGEFCIGLNQLYPEGVLDDDRILGYDDIPVYELKRSKLRQHYSAMSIEKIDNYGSVEFRYHCGTINPDKILNWSNLLLTIFNYAVNGYSHKDVKGMFNMKTSPAKLRRFFKVFQLDEQERSYVQDRIDRFNPNLLVSFSSTTKRHWDMKNRNIQERLNTEIEEAKKERDKAHEEYSTGGSYHRGQIYSRYLDANRKYNSITARRGSRFLGLGDSETMALKIRDKMKSGNESSERIK